MTEGTEITKEKITYNRNDLLNEINNIPFHMPNSKGIFYYLPKPNYERIYPRRKNVIDWIYKSKIIYCKWLEYLLYWVIEFILKKQVLLNNTINNHCSLQTKIDAVIIIYL